MYEIIICPARKLYDIAADADLENVAAIIVSSYSVDQNRLGNLGHCIIFGFADTEEALRDDAVTATDTEKICEFTEDLPDGLDTLFVCCDSGESRSTAIAAAISRHMGLDEMRIWDNPRYHPNGLVYRLVCDGFGIPVSQRDIADRKERNRKAFKQRKMS